MKENKASQVVLDIIGGKSLCSLHMSMIKTATAVNEKRGIYHNRFVETVVMAAKTFERV